MLHLLPEFEYHADLEPMTIGPGPFGNRMVGTVTGGDVRGERLKGRLVGAGADWLLVGDDGFGRLDVRANMETVDGAHLYFQYLGLLELTPAVLAVMAGGGEPTAFEDHYFVTTPRLETGDERYAWVNQAVFVAEGRVLPGPAVEYRVHRVVQG
jgi:uncharacterized protein DUF3237